MMARTALRTLALTGLLGLLAIPVQAQRWTDVDERGWIGISIQVDEDRWGRPSTVVITDVLTGSPADGAGLRPGDRLLAVNELDSPRELRELGERLRLRVGDRVVMEIERAGERRRVRLQAAETPADLYAPRVEYSYASSDDRVETWVRSMDSLAIELVQMGGGQNVRVRAGDGTGRVTVVTSMGRSSVEAPFEFFVFRGEEHDSLKREMVQLNDMMRELEQRLEARERMVRTRTRSTDPLHLAEDEEFRALSRRLDEMSLRSASLEAAMAEAARETAGLAYVRPAAPVVAAGGSGGVLPTPPEPAGEFRPLTPYFLGRNRVAGAQVVDLKPELAQYFEVDGGVLVVDVADGTPAGMAGIVPGDVIVRIDRVAIRSVDDLRFGVSMAGDTLPVTVIRRGQTAQVLLRR